MSYLTHYKLEVLSLDGDPVDVVSGGSLFNSLLELALKKHIGMLDLFLGGTDTWYAHESDIRQISDKFAFVLFKLSGEGESNGDIWAKYFRGGKMQYCHAKIEIPPFDERELR